MGYVIFWLVLLAVFIVAEIATMSFVSMWFAVGSLAALIAAQFGGSVGVQFIAFAVVSALSLALFMKPIKNRFSKRVIPTNADSNIGRVAVCITASTSSSLARVRLDGVDWNARSEAPLNLGDECRILSIQGATLNVEPLSGAKI